MSAQQLSPTLRRLAVAVGLAFTSQVHGAAFQIIEHSAAGLGRAFAGEAAIHDDPSVMAHNAAGIGFIRQPFFTAAGMYISPNVDVRGQYNFANPAFSSDFPLTKGDNNVAKPALIPAIYFSYPFANIWTVGIGAFSDFGLLTKYDSSFSGSLQANKSGLVTANLNAQIAVRPHPRFSFGIGVSAVYADVELSSRFANGSNFTIPTQQGPLTTSLTGVRFFKADDADDLEAGYNLGLMWKPTDVFTIGASFRSETNIDFDDGDITFFNNSTDPTRALDPEGKGLLYPTQKTSAAADLDLPEQWEISFFGKPTRNGPSMAAAAGRDGRRFGNSRSAWMNRSMSLVNSLLNWKPDRIMTTPGGCLSASPIT